MSEIGQLRRRIDDSGLEGVLTEHIRYDYEPIGRMMIQRLTDSGGYVQRLTTMHSYDQKWRIFTSGFEPY